jgi:hypothetical protein
MPELHMHRALRLGFPIFATLIDKPAVRGPSQMQVSNVIRSINAVDIP